MKHVQLVPQEHSRRTGDPLPDLCPTVTEDTMLLDEQGQPLGFYLTKMPPKLANLASIANRELMSSRVPKTVMDRKTPLPDGSFLWIEQYSALLGSIPAKPLVRRAYRMRSSVHAAKSARTFAKAMNAAGSGLLELMQTIAPDVYERHKAAVEEWVPEAWRFAGLFSSTISNCNISVPVHRDNANVKGAVNAIVCMRQNSAGGCLHVPDYDATFEQGHGSLLVYPAWRNSHGVTPIVPTHRGGYRNSLIWYALRGFRD